MAEGSCFITPKALRPAALESDLDVARALARTLPDPELFEYPGDRHLLTDSRLPDDDESAAALLMQPVLARLDTID